MLLERLDQNKNIQVLLTRSSQSHASNSSPSLDEHSRAQKLKYYHGMSPSEQWWQGYKIFLQGLTFIIFDINHTKSCLTSHAESAPKHLCVWW